MRLSGWKLPLERLSATSLAMFTMCPEQFRRKYLLKEKEVIRGEMFVGGVVHGAIERMFQGAGPEEALAESWQGRIEEDGEPEWFDKDPGEMFRRSKQMLITYEPIARNIKPIAVEQRFQEKINGVNIIGYIDQELEDRILEVKTAATKVSKPKPRWGFQGRLYSLVSTKPIEWHVLTKQKTPQVVTAKEAPDLYVPSYNPDATVRIVTQAVERMNDLYARHGADNPWPVDGIYGDWLCASCSFKRDCVAWN